jgi:hypothetical protein
LLLLGLAAGVVSLVPTASAERGHAPTISITGVTVKRTAVRDALAGVASVHARICLSNGPGAAVLITETRRVGSCLKARATNIDPLGVDLSRTYPFTCVSNYLISWAVQARFMVGGGTYAVSIRIRDAFRRLSPPGSIAVSL